jgi:serine/threonine protein kinase
LKIFIVAYAAPEMIAQKTYRGPEVDAWALGVSLFTFVCGFGPFDDDRLPRVYSNIMMARYTFPEHVSADLRDLISGMLKVDPQQRISFDAILDHPWMVSFFKKRFLFCSVAWQKSTIILGR